MNNMPDKCTECGCECKKCSGLDETDIAKLCKRLNESEKQNEVLEQELREIRISNEKELEESRKTTSTLLEQHKRLKASFDETLKRNQELEDQVLKMADELQEEREGYEEALRAVSERLVDATESLNKMDKEMVKNRKDCSLVVQLLKCNQSTVTKEYVSRKVDSFPEELKNKLQDELDLPALGRKQRSQSTPGVQQNVTTQKKITNGRRLFLRRSKSASCDDHCGSKNGHPLNTIPDNQPKKAMQAVYTGVEPGKSQPTRL